MKHYIFLIVLVLFAYGCSGKMPFSGTVTYSDDGAPVTQGVVVFRTPTFIAQGAIKTDGTYTVGTDKANDGLPPGTYQVTVIGTAETVYGPPRNPNDPYDPPTETLIPKVDPKFENPEASGLTAVIDGSTRKYDIQVDRFADKK